MLRVGDALGVANAALVAVNAHWHADQIAEHVGDRAYLSIENRRTLGTAGAIAHLRDWLDGRDVLITNADAWGPTSLRALTQDWDADQPRMLVTADPARADFEGRWRFAGSSLLPWRFARDLPSEPSGLYEYVWRSAAEQGVLSFVETLEVFIDCGTPTDYLRANLLASGGASVIGEGAIISGAIDRCVLWPGAVVNAGEHLVECIRTSTGLTVSAAAPA